MHHDVMTDKKKKTSGCIIYEEPEQTVETALCVFLGVHWHFLQ